MLHMKRDGILDWEIEIQGSSKAWKFSYYNHMTITLIGLLSNHRHSVAAQLSLSKYHLIIELKIDCRSIDWLPLSGYYALIKLSPYNHCWVATNDDLLLVNQCLINNQSLLLDHHYENTDWLLLPDCRSFIMIESIVDYPIKLL